MDHWKKRSPKESKTWNIEIERSTHVEKEKGVTEQVDEVDGNPAEEEDNADAPEKFLCSRHPKSLLVGKV